MEVRARSDEDLKACVVLARVVHEVDGYPPRRSGDLEGFVAAVGSLAAFVAVIGDAVVGHVALHPRTSREAMALATEATSRSESELAVLARLLVAPRVRRAGVGGALLAAATAEAHRRGRWPVLDVATHFGAAIALYERCAWTRVGTVTVPLPPEEPLDEYVYVGPAPRP